MRTLLVYIAFLCAALTATNAAAVDFSFDGYGDLRLVAPSNEVSYLDGGLGKLRYGSEDESPGVHVSELALQARAQFTVGESVKVVAGPLSDFSGEIAEVSPDAGKLKVLVSIFGRETPVEVGFDQVKKI